MADKLTIDVRNDPWKQYLFKDTAVFLRTGVIIPILDVCQYTIDSDLSYKRRGMENRVGHNGFIESIIIGITFINEDRPTTEYFKLPTDLFELSIFTDVDQIDSTCLSVESNYIFPIREDKNQYDDSPSLLTSKLGRGCFKTTTTLHGVLSPITGELHVDGKVTMDVIGVDGPLPFITTATLDAYNVNLTYND
jgi:hypothetical protein